MLDDHLFGAARNADAILPSIEQFDYYSGGGIANDEKNGLFLVTVQTYGCGSGSAIVVYDEKGNLIETITGFTFAIDEPAPVINPSKRMGWTFGPQFNQLQQFFY